MSEVTLVYDDDCGFCTWWADFFAERSTMRVVGFTELTDAERERLPPDYEECSHLLTDNAVYSCGASLEQALAHSDYGASVGPVVGFLRQFQEYEHARERLYHEIADRRGTFGQFVSRDPPADDR